MNGDDTGGSNLELEIAGVERRRANACERLGSEWVGWALVGDVDVTSGVTSCGVTPSVRSCDSDFEWDELAAFETTRGAGRKVILSQDSEDDSEQLSEERSAGVNSGSQNAGWLRSSFGDWSSCSDINMGSGSGSNWL